MSVAGARHFFFLRISNADDKIEVIQIELKMLELAWRRQQQQKQIQHRILSINDFSIAHINFRHSIKLAY